MKSGEIVPFPNAPSSSPAALSNNDRIAVCIGPLYGKIPAKTLLEWIQWQKLMGADQIIVYHSPIGENATNALESLPDLITPIKFSMPQALADIHYHGQIAVINECLY